MLKFSRIPLQIARISRVIPTISSLPSVSIRNSFQQNITSRYASSSTASSTTFDPQVVEAQKKLDEGNSLSEQGDLQAAKIAFEASLVIKATAIAHYNLGVVRPDLALHHLQAALSLTPDDGEVCYNLAAILEASAPVICVQCGVDGLAGDPCKEWNLSLAGYFVVLKGILVTAQENNQKVLLLGGGGYQNSISARAYTYLTSIALGQELDLNSSIPDSVKDYDSFAPSFTLDVEAGNRIDENSEVKLVEIENQFAIYIKELQKLYTIPTKSDA